MALTSMSVVGKAIAPSVKNFLLTNANLQARNGKITVEIGCDELAQAISYAVAKALNSDKFLNAWIPALMANLVSAAGAGGIAFPVGAPGFAAQATAYATLAPTLTSGIKTVTIEA